MSNTGVDVSNLVTSFDASAHTYERRLAGSTRRVATHLLSLIPPPGPDALVHDNCCGTGAFTAELRKTSSQARVHATDSSANMIALMQSLIADHGWQDGVAAEVMDGQALRFPAAHFDLSVTNFGLFFFPSPDAGAREIHRTLRPGGVALVTCWKAIGFLPVFYAVQDVVAPREPVRMAMLERWMRRETLEETMARGGFPDMRVEAKDVLLIHDSLPDMIDGLVNHFHGMAGEQWSGEEKWKIEAATKEVLSREHAGYVVDVEGKVGMKMTAWIAVCRK
ncbi:hypothetical protein MMC34_001001 [Xylographa carneopallida]|nr:hypothetical protein [Xylographa carneopallida]